MKKVIKDSKTGKVIDVVSEPKGETLTQQQWKKQCDINEIMKKYKRVSMKELSKLPISQTGVYGDFSKVTDYHDAMNKVIAANQAFMGLDSNLRTRFHNDPAELIQFLNDKKNLKEAVELGLIDKSKLPKDNPAPPAQDKKES